MSASVGAIVLAGGSSRRMGTDKALLRLGGRTLIEIVVQTLLGITSDVVVAAGQLPRPGWPRLGVPLVADRVPGRGPAAGLDAGLRAVQAGSAVVVACDMPFLNTNLLRRLIAELGSFDAVVPVCGGRRQPLHAVYSRSCLPALDQILEAGGSLNDLLARVRTRVLAEEEVWRIDPDGLSCTNVNDPLEWERVQSLWEARAGEIATP